MKWLTVVSAILAVSVGGATLSAQRSAVAAWREQHERQIVDELVQLVSLPNVAGNDANMRRNAGFLETRFVARGFTVEKTAGAGSPVVFARLDVPNPRGTLTLCIHYDGQPVDPSTGPAASRSRRALSVLNHDNNQHGPDENLRLRNLWEGIEIMASIMTMRPGGAATTGR